MNESPKTSQHLTTHPASQGETFYPGVPVAFHDAEAVGAVAERLRRAEGPVNASGSADLPQGEYLITACDRKSRNPFPPFIVVAADENAARRLAQRNYLRIDSIAPYVAREGDPKPRVYPLGPPISDKQFEADYHNRAADPDGKTGMSQWQATEGGLWILAILARVLRLFTG